ncbi:MAG TPA: transporter [Thermomonas sp.]|nr:transporter [Thermomonas sp.]
MRRLAAILLAWCGCAHAQEIEPRAYSNAPVGVNFAIAGYVFTRGGLNFDASVPITDARLSTSNAVFAYARVFELDGRTAKFDAIVPVTRLFGDALYNGAPIQREVSGFSRPAFRVSVNLYGSPALRLREFASWKQDLIVGASVQVSPPWGQYDASRIVNISGNRWTIKPEIGVSKALGPWTLELQAAATFFGDNDEFLGTRTRSQDAIYSLQGHVIYGFKSGQWLSLDANWFAGGRTRIDGELGDDLQQNWRVGLIYAVPLDQRNSLKFSASSGLWARTGNSFDAIGVAWQHRWGGGI